jgi:8-oxo-dGTP diphosphatase
LTSRTEFHHSAGGLVTRRDEVLLICPGKGRWQLPKGHVEPTESREEAAVREVKEETGVQARVIDELPSIEYWYSRAPGRRAHKRVDYYLMEYVNGDVTDCDRSEVDGAAWFTWDEAETRLTFDNELKVLRRARELVAARS